MLRWLTDGRLRVMSLGSPHDIKTPNISLNADAICVRYAVGLAPANFDVTWPRNEQIES
jgi:hypothetical protein